MISYAEAGERTELTWGDLRQRVANFRNILQTLGIQQNDVVAGFVSNGHEAVIASLATLSMGRSGQVAPRFWCASVPDRFGQNKPKVLVAAHTTRRQQKLVDLTERINGLLAELPSISSAVIFDGGACPDANNGCDQVPRCKVIALSTTRFLANIR